MTIRYGVLDDYKADHSLSMTARGVAAYLSAYPGATFADLVSAGPDKAPTVRKALNELNCKCYSFRYKA